MLYPLSDEGLACMFAQHAGLVSGRWSWVASSPPTGLCRACAACCVARFHHRLDKWRAPIVRLVVPG